MNYELLFNELRDRRIRIALTGANGGFGRTFIAQCRVAPQVELAVLCDRDVEGLHSTLLQMDFAPEALRRMCCDANVIPVVLGGSGQPLDIGRRDRSIPDPIRRAVQVRDR